VRWGYEPTGLGSYPLVIGELQTAEIVYFHESQWDVITQLDLLRCALERKALVATRGANVLKGLRQIKTPPRADIVLIPQNDRPGQTWVTQVIKAIGRTGLVVPVPTKHKDLGEWGKNGLTLDRFEQAQTFARKVEPQNEKLPADEFAPESNTEPPGWLYPRKVDTLCYIAPAQVVAGCLYRGCRLVIGGSPKSYKTWLMMQLCHCIANGLPFLGLSTTKGNVLYCNFELLEPDCRHRFETISKAFSTGSRDRIYVVQLRGKSRAINPVTLTQLTEIILDCDFMLASFDPVYKLLGSRDENKAGDVADLLEPLERIADQGQAALAFCHHFAKGSQSLKYAIDRLAGSNVFARDVDVALTLTELDEEDCFVVEIRQRSFPEIKPFGVRWTYPIFVRDDSIDIARLREPGRKTSAADPVTEKMMAALRAADFEGGLTFTDWISAVQEKNSSGGMSPARSTFNRKLQTLLRPRGPVKKSALTDKYVLSPEHAQKWRNSREEVLR
jgi:AAA domain